MANDNLCHRILLANDAFNPNHFNPRRAGNVH